jgi:hypothetical protein
MFTTEQLATLQIRHLIIHDVPNSRVTPGEGPTLSETETELDVRRIQHLKNRLVSAIGSKSAYDVTFLAETTSLVPPMVRQFTGGFDLEHFVTASQGVAKYLYEMQFGMISSGLLAIMDAAMNGRAAVVTLKIERQEGFQLQLAERNGLHTFSLSVLDNLVLTEGTRLFKAALFRRNGTGDEDFDGAACDSQKSVSTADDVAKFWLRFLGCELSERPRVRTTRFFETVKDFINEVITDPVEKDTAYEHLFSELKSQRRTLSPRTFMEEYMPAPLRVPFKQFFQAANVPMTQFSKDLEDIKPQLRRRSFSTTRGVTITAPVEEENLIDVGAEKIVVNDTLARVGKK